MSKMHISKSISIKAPAEKIFNTLIDFNNWQQWSPWLIQEPEAKVTVSDDKKYYEWAGNRTGTGNMRIIDEKANESIDIDLTFLTPWKSTAKVRFEMKENGGNTDLTWLMDSSWPFFLFWMKKTMTAFVGMDYERGLMMLKDTIEDGQVHSELDFQGTTSFAGCKYVGIKSNCTKETLGSKMSEDFGKIWEFVGVHNEKIAGNALSIYHKWDPVKDEISYTSGVPMSEIPTNLPSGMISGEIPATQIYKLGHTGPYKHLGNAWSTLYNMQRSKTFKTNKKIHPFETYLNNPGEVADNELLTEVHFPII